MVNKKVTGHIIFNWKDNTLRVVKNRPKKLGPYDIPLTLNLNIEIPDMPNNELNVEIEVPQTKVAEMVAEAAFGEEDKQ
jgi:hypothetical protein